MIKIITRLPSSFPTTSMDFRNTQNKSIYQSLFALNKNNKILVDLSQFESTNPSTWFTEKDLNQGIVNQRLVKFMKNIGAIETDSVNENYKFHQEWDNPLNPKNQLSSLFLNYEYTNHSLEASLKVLGGVVPKDDLSNIQEIFRYLIKFLDREITENISRLQENKKLKIADYLPKLSDIAEIESLSRTVIREIHNLELRLSSKYTSKELCNQVGEILNATYPKSKQGYDFHIVYTIPEKHLPFFSDIKNIPTTAISEKKYGIIIKDGEAKTSNLPTNNPSIKNGIVAHSLEDKLKKSPLYRFNLQCLAHRLADNVKEEVKLLSDFLDVKLNPIFTNLPYIQQMYPVTYNEFCDRFNTTNINSTAIELTKFTLFIKQGDEVVPIPLKLKEMKIIYENLINELHLKRLDIGHDLEIPENIISEVMKNSLKTIDDPNDFDQKPLWQYLKDRNVRRSRARGGFETFSESIIDTYPSILTTRGLRNIGLHIKQIQNAINNKISDNEFKYNFRYENRDYCLVFPIRDNHPLNSLAELIEKNSSDNDWQLDVMDTEGKNITLVLLKNNLASTSKMAALQFEKIITGINPNIQDIYSGDIRVPSTRTPNSDAPAYNDLGNSKMFSNFSASARSKTRKTQIYLTDPFNEGATVWSQKVEDWLLHKEDFTTSDIDLFKSLFSTSKNTKLLDTIIKQANRSNLCPGNDVYDVCQKIASKITQGDNFQYIKQALEITNEITKSNDEKLNREVLAEKLKNRFAFVYSRFRRNYLMNKK